MENRYNRGRGRGRLTYHQFHSKFGREKQWGGKKREKFPITYEEFEKALGR